MSMTVSVKDHEGIRISATEALDIRACFIRLHNIWKFAKSGNLIIKYIMFMFAIVLLALEFLLCLPSYISVCCCFLMIIELWASK